MTNNETPNPRSGKEHRDKDVNSGSPSRLIENTHIQYGLMHALKQDGSTIDNGKLHEPPRARDDKGSSNSPCAERA